MPYRVQMLVYIEDDPRIADRVRAAIRDAGGALVEVVCDRASDGALEQFISFLVDDLRTLPSSRMRWSVSAEPASWRCRSRDPSAMRARCARTGLRRLRGW